MAADETMHQQRHSLARRPAGRRIIMHNHDVSIGELNTMRGRPVFDAW
jgi:hypothetical protein